MWVVAATEAVVPRCVPEQKQKSRALVILFGMKEQLEEFQE